MDPNTILRALRQLTARIEEIDNHPDRDWSDLAREALEGIEALDGWLTRGGALPGPWGAAR
ncbi:sensor domain CHASE-containing protein [Streptacidiphilus sp. MAP12-16]|uniref:hypothetical protein n=1 Tax=Streptacidiphilus sp. MAP12-16 TaxID=3156300 RepID=UPI0035174C70